MGDVPDRAGSWWLEQMSGVLRIVPVDDGYASVDTLWWWDGLNRHRVNDDGRWRGPVLTPDEVAALRAERDAARQVLLALAAEVEAAGTRSTEWDHDDNAWRIVDVLRSWAGDGEWPPRWGMVATAIRRLCGVSDG